MKKNHDEYNNPHFHLQLVRRRRRVKDVDHGVAQVHKLVGQHVDNGSLGVCASGKTRFTAKVHQNGIGLRQLHIAINHVGQVGKVQPQRVLDIGPLLARQIVSLDAHSDKVNNNLRNRRIDKLVQT